MKNTFNVLGVAGSTRQSSYSTRALKIALEHAKKHGAEVRLLELNNTVLPLYDPSAPASKEVERAAEAIAWADAFILASPDYHGSISGALKNFLDHFYEEFAGKVFGYIVASHEKGLTVMDQMRTGCAPVLWMEHALWSIDKWSTGLYRSGNSEYKIVKQAADDGTRLGGIWQACQRSIYARLWF